MSSQDDRAARPLLPIEDLSETTMKISLPREARSKRLTIPTLRVVAGPDMLRFASLCAGEDVVIGRDERGDLILTHSSVSRYHTRVSCSPIDFFGVCDSTCPRLVLQLRL